MDIEAKIFETLKNSDKPLKGGEISEMSGIDKKEVDKALKKLKTEEKIYCPKRCFYDAK